MLSFLQNSSTFTRDYFIIQYLLYDTVSIQIMFSFIDLFGWRDWTFKPFFFLRFFPPHCSSPTLCLETSVRYTSKIARKKFNARHLTVHGEAGISIQLPNFLTHPYNKLSTKNNTNIQHEDLPDCNSFRTYCCCYGICS